MKRLPLLLSALFFSVVLQAQSLNINAKKVKEDAANEGSLTQFFNRETNSDDTVGIKQPNVYLVHPKPGIHRLPQDNMPCIVPDLNATVAIPNGWGNKTAVPFSGKPPRIPNPAKPFKLSPSRPLLVQPENNTITK